MNYKVIGLNLALHWDLEIKHPVLLGLKRYEKCKTDIAISHECGLKLDTRRGEPSLNTRF